MRFTTPLFLFLTTLALPLIPQDAARPVPTGTGIVTGHVIDGANDQRISGAGVTISGGGLREPQRTITDADGVFLFRDLPAGSYALASKRSGFLDASLGQRRPSGPPQTLRLAADEKRDDLTIRMFKPSAITGTVTDEAGEAVVKVNVLAYRRVFAGGRPQLVVAGECPTDDRGIYRIGPLEPGEYIIAVPMLTSSPQDGGGLRTGPAMVRDGGSSATHLPPSDGKAQKFATTYYVTGQTAARATAITLDVGELKRTIDIQLRPQRVFNISGTVSVTAAASRGVQVQLVTAGEDEVGGDRAIGTMITGEGGAFSFPAIPGGQYIVRASVRPVAGGAVPQWAEQPISVADKDLNDIALIMRRGFRVSGRFQFEGSAGDPDQLPGGIPVTLDPVSTRYPLTAFSLLMMDSPPKTFAITNVLPGRYAIRVIPPQGRMVTSVLYQGRDVSQTSLLVDASDISGIVVTLSDRITVLTGTVTGTADLDAARVLVFPQDAQTWTDFGSKPTTVRVIDVTSTGSFETQALPAGDYLLAAFDRDTVVDWQDPSFLQLAARVATHVRLGDGERQNADLRIVTIR